MTEFLSSCREHQTETSAVSVFPKKTAERSNKVLVLNRNRIENVRRQYGVSNYSAMLLTKNFLNQYIFYYSTVATDT